MLWYRFIGPAHWIYHGSQIIAGICLSLLGLLDIGNKHLDLSKLQGNNNGDQEVNPLYKVLFEEVPLVIISMVYLGIYVGSGAAIWILQRVHDKRAERDRVDKEKGKENVDVELWRRGGAGDERSVSGPGLGVEVDSDDYELRERD